MNDRQSAAIEPILTCLLLYGAVSNLDVVRAALALAYTHGCVDTIAERIERLNADRPAILREQAS